MADITRLMMGLPLSNGMNERTEPKYPNDNGKDGKKKKIRRTLDTYIKVRVY